MAFASDVRAVPTVLADNDRMRITRWNFEPGATTGWHEHEMDYAIVFVTDSSMAINIGGEVTRIEMKAGESYSRSAGVKHDVKNDGTSAMCFVEVEMKPRST